MADFDPAELRRLADAATQDTLKPGWPWGGSGEWSGNVDGMLGGPAGAFCAAASPDRVVQMLDALDAAEESEEAAQGDVNTIIEHCWHTGIQYDRTVDVDQVDYPVRVIETLRRERDAAESRAQAAEAAIARVAWKHAEVPSMFGGSDVCAECGKTYPCPTVTTLRGDES